MALRDTETLSAHRHDKQLQGIAIETVLEKRRLDQAMGRRDREEEC